MLNRNLNRFFELVNVIEWHLLTLNDEPKVSAQDRSLFKLL